MKIVSLGSDPVVQSSPTPSGSDKRAAAIAAFEKASQQPSTPNAQQTQPIVKNQNSVSAEEMGAITPQTSIQKDISETPSSPSTELNEAPKAPEDTLSSQYASLARKEKALRAKAMQQEQAVKAREEAIAAKERELQAKESEYRSQFVPKDKLTQDPLTTLNELGLSYDKLVELAMNQPKPEDLERMNYQKKIETELKAIRDEQERNRKSIEDNQTSQYQQALRQIRNETSQLVSTDPSFEAIKATNSVDDVVDLIERTFKEDGTLLTVEEAAHEVEEYLVEEAMRLTKLTKIQQKMKPAEKPAEKKQTEPQQQLKTLTNSVSTTRPLSARERAILAFKGEKA